MNNTSSAAAPHLVLYGLRPFDRSAKARWLLLEMGVPFENHWMNHEKKEHESEAFLKINPMGRVPALEVNGQAIFESGAICAYLADLFLEKGLAPALLSPARMDYQKWMYFAVATLDVFQTRIMIIEDMPAGEVQKEKETALRTELRDAMHTLDLTLNKNSFLVANRFGAADIAVSYPLFFCQLWPELKSVMIEFPNVMTYLERLEKMPSAIQSEVFSFRE
jgi:glutathione S-transferase